MSTGSVDTPRRYTAEEYLDIEREAFDGKREFIDGEIRLMSGASRDHNAITANIGRLIGNAIQGTGCHYYVSDMRVKVDADGRYTYPDATLVCSEPEFDDANLDTLLNPQAIFEVLSQSTGAYDRGEKFASYRTIPSLQEYLLVGQRRPHIEHFVRLDDGTWRFNPIEGTEGVLQLVTANLVLPIRDIYQRVSFLNYD